MKAARLGPVRSVTRIMLHSFCAPEVHRDKQKREREVTMCQLSVGARGAGLGHRGFLCMPGILHWRNREKETQEFPSDCHGDFICHRSFHRGILPTSRGSPPFPASSCPWAQKPPPGLPPLALGSPLTSQPPVGSLGHEQIPSLPWVKTCQLLTLAMMQLDVSNRHQGTVRGAWGR